MSAVQLEQAKKTEEEFKDAGFRVEKVGNTTVFERDVPESVVEASRVFIRSNEKTKSATNGNSNGSDDAPAIKP
ncbi:MAG: hypothetical protein JWM21_2668 [Acidobacteria bacterium]|nr:hypothetical protein [Acidobacteriota bacterium]